MPRIEADLSSVSTEYEPIPPGPREFKVTEVEFKKSSGGLPMHVIKTVVDDGSEHQGKPIWVRIVTQTKEGKVNNAALADLKRLFIACLGEEAANDPNADTDNLVGNRFLGVVGIRNYTKSPEKGGGEGVANEFERILPLG